MILGIAVALPLSKLISKDKIPLVSFIGIVLTIIGLVMIYIFVKDSLDVDGENVFSFKNLLLIVSVFLFGTGEVLMTEACMIWSRGVFPAKARGTFEGVRCIFFVWVPMLIGTICGDMIIRAYSDNIVDANGMAVNIPQQNLFLYASFVAALALIPLFFGAREYNKRIKAKNEALAKGIIDPTLYESIPIDENGNAYDLATESGEELVQKEKNPVNEE